jgi:hypothetical protein
VKSTRQRAREALRSDDFRRLFAIRLITQSGDGLFQAALVSSIVFNPEEQNTILGFAIATLVGAEREVFVDGHVREDAASFGDVGDALVRDQMSGSPRHEAPINLNFAAARRDKSY